ncbi:VOC family protein [Microbacterium sp. M1A1_1b]|uniref:VOC family protein n=1 Tax=Curtobacterium sp. VKM Ac-2922 TaxID=2929475 RepID=UPI001FB490AB|nr:VOC family protein [Curtobacterium sp. VKM Ac-2922]MCJ1712686.1 VOC family protein [Curtobacterium sp. VKM Ac-2922]
MSGAVASARVAGVSIDCEDHRELSAFYARLLGGRVDWVTDSAAGVTAGSWSLVAQRVSPYRRPVWPGTSIVHLDLTCERDALGALREHAEACGAVVAPDQPDTRWVVMLDPAGHPFCLTPFAP